MPNTLTPLETEYQGYRFRSRLEARWAVFFTMIGIPWLYEHQGFDVEGRWYLPDFYFPTLDIYGEVKPTLFTPEAFRIATACRSILLDGAPEVRPYSIGVPCGACGLAPYDCYKAGHTYQRIHLGQTAGMERLCFFYGEDMEAYAPDPLFEYAVETARGARFEDGEYA